MQDGQGQNGAEGQDKEFAERLDRVRATIGEAARKAGRHPDAVTLIAVSKFQPVAAVAALLAHGQFHFGENYVQQAVDKQESELLKGVKWHFIGHLQTNKVRYVAGRFDLVHTVDSDKLAQALHKRAQAHSLRQAVLIQVNTGKEPQKAGVDGEGLARLSETVEGLDGLELAGLMCMPPFGDDPEEARPHFATLRGLGEATEKRLGRRLRHLSMGMSSDYVQAIEEGATLVRVGTALFGPRPPKA